MKVALLGAGSWSSALSNVLADNGNECMLWARNKTYAEDFQLHHENTKYLPGIPMNKNTIFSSSAKDVLSGAEVVVLGVGAQNVRKVIKEFKALIPKEAIILNISKGIENETFSLMSDIVNELLDNPYCVLSGPSFAVEVARHLPTAIISASVDKEIREMVQDLFMNDYFRVYTASDVRGVELGGSLKNIIALGCGMIRGMNKGQNITAALMTRGLYEMMKMGVSMGAKAATFAGLSGIGDLFLTCTSETSRNFRAGVKIGQGMKWQEVRRDIGMLVEGIETTKASYNYAKKNNIDMPITFEMYKVLYEDLPIDEAAVNLMTRSKKDEMGGLW